MRDVRINCRRISVSTVNETAAKICFGRSFREGFCTDGRKDHNIDLASASIEVSASSRWALWTLSCGCACRKGFRRTIYGGAIFSWTSNPPPPCSDLCTNKQHLASLHTSPPLIHRSTGSTSALFPPSTALNTLLEILVQRLEARQFVLATTPRERHSESQ